MQFDITQEIVTLKTRIEAAASEIAGLQEGDERGASAELAESLQARDLMRARLRRLQSCKRTLD